MVNLNLKNEANVYPFLGFFPLKICWPIKFRQPISFIRPIMFSTLKLDNCSNFLHLYHHEQLQNLLNMMVLLLLFVHMDMALRRRRRQYMACWKDFFIALSPCCSKKKNWVLNIFDNYDLDTNENGYTTNLDYF